jgi:CheY-like chemotaxis protein
MNLSNDSHDGSHEGASLIEAPAPRRELSIVIYSSNSTTRASVAKALGKRLSKNLPEHQVIEFATGDSLKEFASGKKRVDLFILDGEAVPEGGMGIARQLKDEIFQCPPTVVITGRAQDAWLAGWSGADAVVTHPIDPFTLARSVARILE